MCRATNDVGQREDMIQVIVERGPSRPDQSPSRPDYDQSRPDYGQSRPDYGQSRPDYGQNRPNYGPSQPSPGVAVGKRELQSLLGGNAELKCFVVGKTKPSYVRVDVDQSLSRNSNWHPPELGPNGRTATPLRVN